MSSPESKDRANSSNGSVPRTGRSRRASKGGADQPARAESSSKEETTNPRGPETTGSRDSGPSEQSFGWTYRDFLVPYILLSLSLRRAHGYFIEQYLRGLGLANVEMSTLYRTLRQLEKDGLVYSTWEPGPEGPARRIYSLTDTGHWWLDAGAAALAS